MRCERAQELFSEYCEGAMQGAMVVSLESHLDACAECRVQVEGMKQVWQMLDTAPMVEPPADFHARVWQRIEESEQRRTLARRPRLDWRAWFAFPRLGWAAAALMVVLLAGVVVPGRYTRAGMLFPWSLFASQSARGGVSIGAPSLRLEKEGRFVAVPLTSTLAEPAEVEITVTQGPADLVGSRELVVVGAGAAEQALLPLRDNAWSAPITLRITWKQNDETRTATVKTPVR